MKLFFFAAALLFVTVSGAKAQDQATVVASCGTAHLTAGQQAFRTVDVNGVTCSGTGSASTSVWSAADAAANSMTLSNGGLTVSEPGPALPNAWQILRGSISKTSGKLYIEFKTSTGLTTVFHYGLASTGVNINSYLGDSNYSAGISPIPGSFFNSPGFIAGGTITAGAANVNDVFALAVDFATNKAWTARNNVWDNSGDPVAETNPVIGFTPATVGALFPAMAFAQAAPASTWTLQPTAASQKYAPPSGFKAWDAP